MRYFGWIIDVIAFIKGCWAILALALLFCWLFVHFRDEIAANIHEPEPTPFTADGFPKEYAGQYWLKLSGILALEQRFVEKQKVPEDTVSIWVPLVPVGWQPDEPVHAVIRFYDIAAGDLENWVLRNESNRRYTTTGVVDGHSFRRHFPQLKAGEPLVVVRDNSAPKSMGELITILVAVTIAPLCGVIVYLRFRNALWQRIRKWLWAPRPEYRDTSVFIDHGGQPSGSSP